MSLSKFSEWVESKSAEINHVSELLRDPLPDDPEELIHSLTAVESWNGRMQFLLADANTWLSTLSFEFMPEKRNKIEFERKLELNAAIAIVKQRKDKMESICDAIKTRITLGQSLIRYYVANQAIAMQTQNKSIRQILGD